MNRRSILTISAIAALGLAVLPGNAVAQQKTIKEQLVGTWTPVSWEQDVASGPKFQRFGANPKGVTVFDANGRFFIMFARSDLPKIASNNPSTSTPEEAKAIVSGSIAYYGTYTVDEAAKIISFRIESSSFPNQLGIEGKRAITSLTATELKHTNTTVVGGNPPIHVSLRRAN
ncbi:MAG: lipocalin-like domain-containing protein [Tardiphaga sp.]